MPKFHRVRMAQFAYAQDGPGLSVASSVTAYVEGKRPSRHTLAYDPVYGLLVTYKDHDKPADVALIPPHRISCIRFEEDFGDTSPVPASASSKKSAPV